MAEIVLTNAQIVMGESSASCTDVSTAVNSVTINYSAELKDVTGFTMTGRARKAGLKDASIVMAIKQDHASTDIDKFLWNSIGTSDVWLAVKPTTSTAGASNPRYFGHFLPESYTPITGGVGDLETFNVTFQNAAGILTRSTATT